MLVVLSKNYFKMLKVTFCLKELKKFLVFTHPHKDLIHYLRESLLWLKIGKNQMFNVGFAQAIERNYALFGAL